MDLQTNESFGVRLVDLLVNQILDWLAVDRGLDPRALGGNPVLIPLTVFEVLMGNQTLFGRQPASLRRFAENVSGQRPFFATGLDLDLWTVDPSRRVDGTFACRLGLGF